MVRFESSNSVVSFLFCIEILRGTFGQVSIQGAAIFHFLKAFALEVFSRANPGLGCTPVQLREQDAVVKLMNFQRDFVFCLLGIRASLVQFARAN